MLSRLPTKRINDIFSIINLTEDHAKTYIANLELGAFPASNIARKSKLPRSSTYYLLDDLLKIGLVSLIEGESKKIYSPTRPEVLLNAIGKKEEKIVQVKKNFKSLLPELNNLYLSNQPDFPKVSYFEGESGLKTVLYDCFSSKEVFAICQENNNRSLSEEPKYILDFVEQVGLRDIMYKELMYDIKANREYKKEFESKKHQILLIPANPQAKFHHFDKQIYQDKVAYISLDNKIGIIIEDASLANAEKTQFEDLWKYYKSK
jgi:sugar-specific transcriptional regulator TrmB